MLLIGYFFFFGKFSLWSNGKKHICSVIWDLLPCRCLSPVVRMQGLLGSWLGWALSQCRSSGLGITTLVSILLLERVFFEGSIYAFNPLFCQSFWCPIILSSCRSSCFYYKSPHPLGSPGLQADSPPEMRHNASTEVTGAAVWLAPVFPKWSRKHHPLSMAASDPPWPVQALWQLMWRNTLYWKKFEGAHRYLELCWALAMGVSAEQPPCSLCMVQPPWLSRDSCAVYKQLPHCWKQLALGLSHIYTWSCKPMWPNAHDHAGLFLFICMACLGSAPSDSLGLSASETLHLEKGGWMTARICFGLVWFEERKDMFLYHPVLLSNWLLCTAWSPVSTIKLYHLWCPQHCNTALQTENCHCTTQICIIGWMELQPSETIIYSFHLSEDYWVGLLNKTGENSFELNKLQQIVASCMYASLCHREGTHYKCSGTPLHPFIVAFSPPLHPLQ